MPDGSEPVSATWRAVPSEFSFLVSLAVAGPPPWDSRERGDRDIDYPRRSSARTSTGAVPATSPATRPSIPPLPATLQPSAPVSPAARSAASQNDQCRSSFAARKAAHNPESAPLTRQEGMQRSKQEPAMHTSPEALKIQGRSSA